MEQFSEAIIRRYVGYSVARSINIMKNCIIALMLLFSVPAYSNPYDGSVSKFVNGKQVTMTYRQLLQDESLEGLSPLSKVLHERALTLIDNPDSSYFKSLYLEGFPRSFDEFMDIFQPKGFDQLYGENFIYIGILNTLSAEYPNEVGDIYLKLAGKACLDADAPNQLRYDLLLFEQQHPNVYQSFYKKLPREQQNNIERFKAASIHDGGIGVCDF